MVVKIFIAYFWTNEENMIVHITGIVYKKKGSNKTASKNEYGIRQTGISVFLIRGG